MWRVYNDNGVYTAKRIVGFLGFVTETVRNKDWRVFCDDLKGRLDDDAAQQLHENAVSQTDSTNVERSRYSERRRQRRGNNRDDTA